MKLKKLTLLITLIIATISSAFSLVVRADADKTALTTAYNEVQAIINSQDTSPVGDPYYEVASYQAFMDLINGLGGTVGIQAVIDDPLAAQQDVDDLTVNINSAINGLVLHDTYYATLAHWSQAKTEDISNYTSTSQSLYHNELDRIKLILDDPVSGETTVQSLNTDIDNASDLLVLRGDKTEVLAKKTEIETIYNSTGEDYIPSSYTNFKAEYDNIDTVLTADIGMTLQELIDNLDALVSEVSQAEIRLDNVLSILILKPDKQNLIDDYNDALAIDEDLYTTSSYEAFELGLEDIIDVINDLEALEADVIQAESDLSDLYTLLVLRGNISDLQEEFNTAKAIDLDLYTPTSVELYEAELDRIEIIMLSDDSDQTDVDFALGDLLSAYDLLVQKADKEDLMLLNTLLIDAYYRDINLYTESSHEAFKAACDAFGGYLYVNQIIANQNATQAEVDNLAIEVSNALLLLVNMADNDQLLDMYSNLITRDLSSYTLSSRTAYNLELDRLYTLIISPNLDIDMANAILLELAEANDLLVEIADFSFLQEAYDDSLIYKSSDYTISSYQYLLDARTQALNLLSDTDATQSEIDDTITLIETAIDELRQKLETIYIVQGNTLDINQYITLGQASIIKYEIEDQSVLSINNQGIITGLIFGETNVRVYLSNGAIEIIDVFVKARPSTAVYIMTISLPVVSVGFAFGAIYIRKETWIKLVNIVRNIFKKRS